MTIATRKQREKEEMRSLILDAARKIFLEKGYHDTSMRNIAEEIQYSPGTIYLYFRDKDEIFHALHEEGFRRMLTKMQPLGHVSSPFERLKALGKVYLEFATENKDFYDLMFIMQAPIKHEADHEQWEMGHQTLDYLKQVLTECKKEGYFKGKNIEYLSFAVWSGVHGMAALYCRERCKAYHDIEPGELIEEGYKYLVNMLENL
ncbi:MAG: TetR/AcrR family transcriptional regulator [Sphingobacteriales bacterium]|nr:MAG: TetR/AcrR family transcriptional regulator [Sphingobacteriales bacterium]